MMGFAIADPKNCQGDHLPLLEKIFFYIARQSLIANGIMI